MKRLLFLFFISAGIFSVSATSTAAPASFGGEIEYMTDIDDNCKGRTTACAVVTPDKNEQ
ncbi:hypothetical protein FUA23_17980 [Neolewinella aurantiaca]|uniref:Uncharacterized protein n=1 Tax=Neolewinella aurantiaca TaxID=2602767 RepID=A0A5C7FE00_9BACT|nr:hypothetical protein [Neolewinella aurantiaca]TXF87700.1 hypothetical protein FUA23_17980 [Neolewinella aurantiaca]